MLKRDTTFLKGKKKKGQSTMEYVILSAGVIAVIIIVLNPTTGLFSQRLKQVFNTATGDMVGMSSALGNSHVTPRTP